MKPVKLKEHQNANHQGNMSDSRNTFLQQKVRFERGKTLDRHGFNTTGKPRLEASYKVAYQIAKDKSCIVLLKH